VNGRTFLLLLIALTACSGPISQATPVPTPTLTAPPTVPPSLTRTPPPSPTSAPKLKIGESAGFPSPGDTGEVRVTVLALDETTRTSFITPAPGRSHVSVVVRYDNGLNVPIQVSEFPWQLASADGVRHRSTIPARNDALQSGSVVVPGGFLVGSLTFEAPPGPLDLYYVQPGTTGRVAIWAVR
jgi:hypothetical protein